MSNQTKREDTDSRIRVYHDESYLKVSAVTAGSGFLIEETLRGQRLLLLNEDIDPLIEALQKIRDDRQDERLAAIEKKKMAAWNGNNLQ